MVTRNSNGVRCERAVVAVLPRSADVRTRADRSGGADLVVNGSSMRVVWAGDGRLGDVRRVLAGGLVADVVVARQLSPGALAELARAGVGWVDETGAAEISFGSIVVARSGRPVRREVPRRWTPSVLAVAEAALCGVRATASVMREATGLSTGSCVNALRVLTDLELLEAAAGRGRGSARRVSDSDLLLRAYVSAAAALAEDLRLDVGVTWRDLVEGLGVAGKRWASQRVEWAVTGAVAADALAPYLTSVTSAEVYVSADTVLGLEAAAAAAGLKPVEGGRLVLRPFPTRSTDRLATRVGGLRVAPWPRVYADLGHGGVRGEDAAEHLKEVVGGR